MQKIYKSTQKFLLVSPRKVRLVVSLIKKLNPLEALEKLPFANKRAAYDLAKVIRSAVANAKAQGASDTDLIFKEIQIGQGPSLKRGRAASRGRWHGYKKKMSHISVVLTTKAETPSKKTEPKVTNNKKKVNKEKK